MKKIFKNKISFLIVFIMLFISTFQFHPVNTQKVLANSSGITIHFKNDCNWNKVNIYYYNDTSTGPSWPGTAMTAEGNNWYTYTIPNLASAKVLFNNGADKQIPSSGQPGYNITTETWYKDGQLYTKNPDWPDNTSVPTSIAITSNDSLNIGQAITLTGVVTYSDGSKKQDTLNWKVDDSTLASLSSVSASSVNLTALKKGSVTVTASEGNLTAKKTITISDSVTSSIKVYFKSPWKTAKIYYWNTTPSILNSPWPGINMTSEGNDWYSYTFNGVTSTNLIFNNGSGSQTSDLSRTTGTWYYSNNTWSDKDPRIDTTPPVITASPASGKVENASLSVTLTASDNVDSNPKIYYTTDGTNPVVGSNLYNGSILINEDTTIKAIAVDNSGNISTVYNFSYMLNQDVTPPVVTPSLPAGKYETAQNITLNVKDNNDKSPKLYYTTDGTKPLINDNYLYKGQSIHADKFTHIYTIAVDASGNSIENHFMYNIGGTQDDVDFRKETIYFVITTRFYDGDPSNNVHCWDDTTAKNPDTDPAWRGIFMDLQKNLITLKL